MLFSHLAEYLNRLEQIRSRNAIIEILSELFSKATSSEIGMICYLLQGRVAPLYEDIEFGLAEKFIIRAIARACDISIDEVVRSYKKAGDLGVTIQELKGTKRNREIKGNMDVVEIFEGLHTLALTGGQGSQDKKIDILSALIRSCDPLSARYLVRIPIDKLRLGFSETTVLDALSWMLAGDKSLRTKLEDAYNVRPDIGFIAEAVKEGGINALSHIRARVGSPVLSQLCQRLPTADEMIKKMGEVAVEPKYDGVRVQIHYKSGKVTTYSRNLENTTAMFSELSAIGYELHTKECILDCEAVGMDKDGKLVSFQETTTRKRKHDIEAAIKNVPLKFFVFDILYKDGTDLLDAPLSERREILEHTVNPQQLLALSPQIVTDLPDVLRDYHDTQIKAGLEGVVVKKWDSAYEPGRRGFSWVKFKEEEGKTGKLTDTIDAVIMGYYLGEGKRTGFGIGALLVGIRKGDVFVTVTKIGTGVSDELWKSLRQKLHAINVKMKPKEYHAINKLLIPDVWVMPKIVVEIAGDDLTKSPTHGAGFAVRFPRLVGIRTDKRPGNATTTHEVAKMYANQYNIDH